MKTITSFFSLFVLAAALSFGQTATPSTTLCAAMTAAAKTVCLTSGTGVVNQTGLYIDNEYMVVNLSSSATVANGGYVPVIRGTRAAGSGPTSHANAALVWVALTPSSALMPGVNGFNMGTNLTDVGPCVRANEIYLPHIWPNKGMKRDCNIAGTTATSGGVWVDYAPALGADVPSPSPLVSIAANQALAVASGNYVLITKTSGITVTLAAPTAGVQDGMVISITADQGAYASVLTATSLLMNGLNGAPFTTATFGVTTTFVGGTLILKAYGGYWFVVSAAGVVLT